MAPHQKIPIANVIDNEASPPTLTPENRSALLTALMSSSAIPKIHTTLLSACQSTGWLDSVRERALQLLRSGECTSYREIMAVLKEEVRAPLLPPPAPPPALPQGNEAGRGGRGGGRQEDDVNDAAAAGERGSSRLMRRNGSSGKEGDGDRDRDRDRDKDRVIDVRIPAKVYNDGVRAVRKALEGVVDVVVD